MTSADSIHDAYPKAFFVAGAPGSGKSALMPVALLGVDAFNADDAAAKLNNGSYLAISPDVRARVNRTLEQFITGHIESGVSFAVETTLRSTVALEQARSAREAGFFTTMLYICTASSEINVTRVAKRARGGGHSAPIPTLLDIRGRSYSNLYAAIASVGTALDELEIFDNSVDGNFMQSAFRLTVGTDRQLSIDQNHVPDYLAPYLHAATSRLA